MPSLALVIVEVTLTVQFALVEASSAAEVVVTSWTVALVVTDYEIPLLVLQHLDYSSVAAATFVVVLSQHQEKAFSYVDLGQASVAEKFEVAVVATAFGPVACIEEVVDETLPAAVVAALTFADFVAAFA